MAVNRANHDSSLQSELFALLMEKKPEDEFTESIVREAIEDWAETASLDLKRKHAQRTFENPFWRAGAVLSWIAYRDWRLICQFENRRDWGTAKWYNNDGPAWKVDHPDAELIRALQDGRLRSSRQAGFDLPEDLPPKFWARITVRRVFAIDPIFERVEVLELWKADPAESAKVVGSAAATATKKQTETPVTRGRGRRAELRPRIVVQMKRDIENGKWSTDDLRKMTQESLAATYGAKSRETAQFALKEVLSEIVGK
jgi:hypothetical protein